MQSVKGSVIDNEGKMNNFAIEPTMYVDEEIRTGFTPYAEKLNGRLAMIGIVSAIAFEALTGQGLIEWFTNL